MKFNRIFLILIFILTIGYVAALQLYKYPKTSPYRISPAKANEWIKNKQIDVVLDVRTSMERATLGYYPGSMHIPSTELKERILSEFPDRNTFILVHCNTGHRARLAAEVLHDLGYKKTKYIAESHKALM